MSEDFKPSADIQLSDYLANKDAAEQRAQDDDATVQRSTQSPDVFAAPARSSSVRVGSTLKERFILEEEIARGGMGVVYRARDLRKEQFKDRDPYIAVKVLEEHFQSHPQSLIALQREAGKAQKLAHPNIVTVFDFDCDGDTFFMTMEFLKGESLDQWLRRDVSGQLTLTECFGIISQIGQGLAYAHQNSIIHCDLKPGNIFLTHNSTVKILDFGISRAVKNPDVSQSDATHFDVGKFGALTPAYASCEMIENEPPDARDDIYALACVAYEILTGRHPFNKVIASVARDSRLKPERAKRISNKQWSALKRGLSFSRNHRQASVDAFLDELQQPSGTSGTSKRRLAFMALSVVALLGLGSVLLPRYTLPPVQQHVPAPLPTPPQPVELTGEQLKTIDRLLEAAEIHFMVGRITVPEGSNAYEAYQHVLEIDPANAQARQGLHNVADHFEKLAHDSLQENNTQKTLSLIQAGLKVMPQHAGLRQLERQVHESRSYIDSAINWIKHFINR